MDSLLELEEKLSKLRSLSQAVDKKISDAKDSDANVASQVDLLQRRLTELRQRTLLTTLLQLQSRLESQRQRLDHLELETAYGKTKTQN